MEHMLSEILHRFCTKLFSSKEKKRISECLNDSESNVATIFFENLKNTKYFRDYADNAKVKGFSRPGNQKTAKVLEQVTSALKKNTAKKIEWDVYREVCLGYIMNQKTNLAELLDEEVLVDEDFLDLDEKKLTVEYLELLCSHAKKFSVYRHDLELIYELFPLHRLEQVDAILDKAPEYGRLNEVSDAIADISKEVEQNNNEIRGRLISLKESLNSLRVSTDESVSGLGNQINQVDGDLSIRVDAIARDFEKLKNEVSAQLEESVDDRAATNDFVVNEIAKITHLENRISDFVLETKLRFDTASASGTDNHNASGINQSSQSDKYHSGWIAESLLREAGTIDVADFIEVEEDAFLANFVSRCAFDRIQYSKEDMVTYHRLIMASSVIQIDDPDLLDCWLKSLGWSSAHYQTSASPTWSDPEQWLNFQQKLFEEPDLPAVVSILDFDKGLVSAYLEPILKQWGQADTINPIKKLFLVKSRTGEPMRDLESPLMCLNEYHPELTLDISPPSHQPKEMGVSIDSFKAWSRTKTFSAGKAKRNRFIKALVSDSIVAPKSLTRLISGVEQTLTGYAEREVIEGYCRTLVLLPWLKATQSKSIIEKYDG